MAAKKKKPGKLTAQQRRWVAEFKKERRDTIGEYSAPGLEHLGSFRCRAGARPAHWYAQRDGLDLGTYFLARELFSEGRDIEALALMSALVARPRGALPIRPRSL